MWKWTAEVKIKANITSIILEKVNLFHTVARERNGVESNDSKTYSEDTSDATKEKIELFAVKFLAKDWLFVVVSFRTVE